MRFTITTISVSSLLVLGGCIRDLVYQGAELAPDSDTDTGTPTTSGQTPTTEPSPGTTSTLTGDEDSEPPSGPGPGSNSEDTATDPPPAILEFDVSPNLVQQAGVTRVYMLASEDVVEADLRLDGALVQKFYTNEFSYDHEVFSAKDNIPARTFEVEVWDAASQSADANATIGIVLPPTGQAKCTFSADDQGKLVSSISALRYTPTALVAVGTRQVGTELKLALWLLHPETCQVLPEWPRSIADWSELDAGTSFGSAVDVDTSGNLVVAGNFIKDNKPRSYVALLTPDGELLWEHAGSPGDEVNGVAAASRRHSDRVFVVGSQRTDDNPVRTDAAIWIYRAMNKSVAVLPPTILKAPFTEDEVYLDPWNERSEWVRAVAIHPDTGNAFAVGEREFHLDKLLIPQRGFTVVIDPNGGLISQPWTSPANTGFLHNAARSVTSCGDGFLAGGWTRDTPADAKPQPIIFWLDATGWSTQQRVESQLTSSITTGIACDRESKIISAGTRALGQDDAQVFMILDAFSPRVVYEEGEVDENDGAGAVACDSRGICAWGGYRTVNAKPYAVVQAHHP